MMLERVGQPTVRFVAVSEATTDRWFALAVGALLGLPTGLVLGLAWLAVR